MAVLFDEVKGYDPERIRDSIRRGFARLGIDPAGRRRAFIKVNVVRPAAPASCVVTHPAVAEALILLLREAGVEEILLGDGPAAGVEGNEAFRKSGYLELARRCKIRLVDLNTAPTVSREWAYGRIDLPVDVVESDFYINAVKMKTHFHAGVTLSLKNQQGLLTPEAKKANHREHDLHEALVEIARVIRPHAIVVDAVESMEGEGPTQGKKRVTNTMVYGTDPFETDVACCRFMGVEISRVPHLAYAIRQGLGTPEPEILGEAFETHRGGFEMPSPKPKQILNFYSWKNYRACAEDEHSFEEAIHLALTRPKYWFTFFPKFFYFVVFRRFHLLRGRKARVPEEVGRVLCIGNCCREVARENDADFVPGCPPQPEDILEVISRMPWRSPK